MNIASLLESSFQDRYYNSPNYSREQQLIEIYIENVKAINEILYDSYDPPCFDVALLNPESQKKLSEILGEKIYNPGGVSIVTELLDALVYSFKAVDGDGTLKLVQKEYYQNL